MSIRRLLAALGAALAVAACDPAQRIASHPSPLNPFKPPPDFTAVYAR